MRRINRPSTRFEITVPILKQLEHSSIFHNNYDKTAIKMQFTTFFTLALTAALAVANTIPAEVRHEPHLNHHPPCSRNIYTHNH